MGIINPRPAMRAREERNLKSTLRQHNELRYEIRAAGVGDTDASSIAFNIVRTKAARKRIWRRK